MSQNRSVSVTFTPTATYTLTIRMDANGYGRIYVADFRATPKIACNQAGAPLTCTTQYPATTRAELEFTTSGYPNAATSFSGFGGDCTGSGRCVAVVRERGHA